MTTGPADFRLPGAVDLGSSAAPPPPRSGRGGGAAGAAVIDVSEATFQSDVVERSKSVPVVLDFWAEWCGPCRQLSPVLEKLAAESGGTWVLAKIDVDANPRLAQAAGVQGIPAVKGIVQGQIVGEFTGAMPEGQVRQWIDQLLDAGRQLGLAGAPEGAAEPAPPPAEPELVEAAEALQRNDFDTALTAYQALLARQPANAEAKTGVARVKLVQRARGLDERAVRQAAADAPKDVDAALAVADVDMVVGRVADAFDRLVEVVRDTAGDERERVRTHLLELFDVLEPDDPRLISARRALANALF